MISYQRLFDIYRAMADSFDAYLRTVVFHQQIKGWNRLTDKLIEIEQTDDDQ